MTTETWLLYVGTVLVLMSTPGPSHLLMLSTSMSSGFHRSLATAAGDLTANAIQILLAGFGLAAVITSSQYGLAVVKWAGVAYLVWLGGRQILDSFRGNSSIEKRSPVSIRRLWLRGFITSAANPKAVVFFAALFPQFLNADEPLAPQIAILGASYLFIDGCFLSVYGKGAGWLARKVEGHRRVWLDRIAGTSIIGAAVLLGLRSSETT
ncbi:MAG: LysE family translocator [Pseudomonadota bacterium]